MKRSPSRGLERFAAGYTLLEMMVVLAIISVLAAVSWPMLRRPLSKSRLQDGAQQLSKALADLRLVAMEEGRPYLFRYQMGASAFQSFPAEFLVGDPEQQTSAEVSPSLETIDSAADDFDFPRDDLGDEDYDRLDSDTETFDVENLPDGVLFFDTYLDSYEAPNDVQALEDRALTDGRDDSAASTEVSQPDSESWSAPIRFYPDGRATSAKLVLVGENGYQVDVSVRGLTGAVRVSSPRRIEVEPWEEESPKPPIP